jgi:hypothetical protein
MISGFVVFDFDVRPACRIGVAGPPQGLAPRTASELMSPTDATRIDP